MTDTAPRAPRAWIGYSWFLCGALVVLIILHIGGMFKAEPQQIRASLYDVSMTFVDSFVGPYDELFDTLSGDWLILVCTHTDEHASLLTKGEE